MDNIVSSIVLSISRAVLGAYARVGTSAMTCREAGGGLLSAIPTGAVSDCICLYLSAGAMLVMGQLAFEAVSGPGC